MNKLVELPAEMREKMRLPFPWEQGQHLSIIGGTGSGKTTLANALIQWRKYTLALRSKADRTPLPGLQVKTYPALRKAMANENVSRILVDPPYEKQLPMFWNACELAWKQKSWAIYFDELFYLQDIGLEKQVRRFLTQGRSQNLTTICGMQRPVGVTRYALSEPMHLISFRVEPRDIKTLAELGAEKWAEQVAELEEYQFAWYHRAKREVFVGRVQDLFPGAD